MKHHEQDAEGDVEDMALRQQDRRARHAPVEFQEGDDRAGEGDRADGEAERHLDDRIRMDARAFRDAEGFRRIERAGRDEHRREADQRVEHRHELRHRGHLHGAGAPGADAPADGEAEDDQQPREEAGRGFSASVVKMATPMPIMPKRLPCRDEAGDERPRKARMNRTPATR